MRLYTCLTVTLLFCGAFGQSNIEDKEDGDKTNVDNGRDGIMPIQGGPDNPRPPINGRQDYGNQRWQSRQDRQYGGQFGQQNGQFQNGNRQNTQQYPTRQNGQRGGNRQTFPTRPDNQRTRPTNRPRPPTDQHIGQRVDFRDLNREPLIRHCGKRVHGEMWSDARCTSDYNHCDNGKIIVRSCGDGAYYNRDMMICAQPLDSGCTEEDLREREGKSDKE